MKKRGCRFKSGHIPDKGTQAHNLVVSFRRVMKLLTKIFYGLPDKFVHKTDARSRRALNFWFFMFWLIPGTILWFILKDSLWFVGLMSLYALWATHFGGFSAETPVEQENK